MLEQEKVIGNYFKFPKQRLNIPTQAHATMASFLEEIHAGNTY